MGLESDNVNTINGLDPSWPLSSDATIDGDDHIRLIKRVLKNIFPNGQSGSGFNKPVLATVDELNHLQGAESNIQDQIDKIYTDGGALAYTLTAPLGTILFIYIQPNKSLPYGWKSVPDVDGHMLIATTRDEAGALYGKNDPWLWTHTHACPTVKISAANLPRHGHFAYFSDNIGVPREGGDDVAPYYASAQVQEVDTFGSGWGQNDPLQLPNTLSSTWEPRVAGVLAIERDDP